MMKLGTKAILSQKLRTPEVTVHSNSIPNFIFIIRLAVNICHRGVDPRTTSCEKLN